MGIFDKFNQMSLDIAPPKAPGHAIETCRIFTMCACEQCNLKFQPIKRGIRNASEQTLCSIPCGQASLEGMLGYIKQHFNPSAEADSQNGLFSQGGSSFADAGLGKLIDRIERLPKEPDSEIFVSVYLEAKSAYERIQNSLAQENTSPAGMRP